MSDTAPPTPRTRPEHERYLATVEAARLNDEDVNVQRAAAGLPLVRSIVLTPEQTEALRAGSLDIATLYPDPWADIGLDLSRERAVQETAEALAIAAQVPVYMTREPIDIAAHIVDTKWAQEPDAVQLRRAVARWRLWDGIADALGITGEDLDAKIAEACAGPRGRLADFGHAVPAASNAAALAERIADSTIAEWKLFRRPFFSAAPGENEWRRWHRGPNGPAARKRRADRRRSDRKRAQ